jgi:hypothetical protein
MRVILRTLRFVLLAGLAIGLSATALQAGDPPPNWKGSGSGTTKPVGDVHVDAFDGKSTHLGRFTGEGYHVLFADFSFVGQATWTASNGDSLSVTYVGQAFLSGDPDYPFGFVAVLTATGGTGRLAGAHGVAAMTGAFTGVPGDLYFDFEGTLSVNGK